MEDISKKIKDKVKFYPDFPKPGVTFMDLFSLTSDPPLFKEVNDSTAKLLSTEA